MHKFCESNVVDFIKNYKITSGVLRYSYENAQNLRVKYCIDKSKNEFDEFSTTQPYTKEYCDYRYDTFSNYSMFLDCARINDSPETWDQKVSCE